MGASHSELVSAVRYCSSCQHIAFTVIWPALSLGASLTFSIRAVFLAHGIARARYCSRTVLLARGMARARYCSRAVLFVYGIHFHCGACKARWVKHARRAGSSMQDALGQIGKDCGLKSVGLPCAGQADRLCWLWLLCRIRLVKQTEFAVKTLLNRRALVKRNEFALLSYPGVVRLLEYAVDNA